MIQYAATLGGFETNKPTKGAWPRGAPSLRTDRGSIKARSLPSSALWCTPQRYYEPLGFPPSSTQLQPSDLIHAVYARRGCQVGPLLFRVALCRRAGACDPGEVQHPFRFRMLSVAQTPF